MRFSVMAGISFGGTAGGPVCRACFHRSNEKKKNRIAHSRHLLKMSCFLSPSPHNHSASLHTSDAAAPYWPFRRALPPCCLSRSFRVASTREEAKCVLSHCVGTFQLKTSVNGKPWRSQDYYLHCFTEVAEQVYIIDDYGRLIRAKSKLNRKRKLSLSVACASIHVHKNFKACLKSKNVEDYNENSSTSLNKYGETHETTQMVSCLR